VEITDPEYSIVLLPTTSLAPDQLHALEAALALGSYAAAESSLHAMNLLQIRRHYADGRPHRLFVGLAQRHWVRIRRSFDGAGIRYTVLNESGGGM
jgi:hypothetical protein